MAKPTNDTVFQMLLPEQTVSFDPVAFDDLIRTHGVEMVHMRAMRCPVGMIDPDDIRRPHEHHENCSNGYIYTTAGTVTCGFLSNSKESRQHDAGRLDQATVQIVLPRFYDASDCCAQDTVSVDLAPFDRIYLKEEAVTVVTWHTFLTHITGTDRLMFPATKVVDLVDSQGKRYVQGSDFQLVAGNIVWNEGRGPGIDPKSLKGRVCSIRFHYRPYWYVKSLPHEARVAQIEDEFGDRSVIRMPQSAHLQREYAFQKEQNDREQSGANNKATGETGGPNSPRLQPGPADGIFGPR